MGDLSQEQIVMTPKKKTPTATTLIMERVPLHQLGDTANMHVAGGNHAGLVINKKPYRHDPTAPPAQLSLEFRVFLVNTQTNLHTQESRTLLFWFKPQLQESQCPRQAQEFFKELVSPLDFPRDYIGFIKKIMKLMQYNFPYVRKVEVELKQLDNIEAPIHRPMTMDDTLSDTSRSEVTEERVLEMIESSYPNPISIHEMAKQTGYPEGEIEENLGVLTGKGLVRTVESSRRGPVMYTRVTQNESELHVVRQMPTMISAKQPTIAIISAQYCEKLAVDAMVENKETFVRYTTVDKGESNVYTLGNIGAHRVVATKLPSVGHTRGAVIAAGNTTTRLLGTFQKVDYVVLVGVGGGVPHYTDWNQHVRLGDVVVSSPVEGESSRGIYTFCGAAKECVDGSWEFETKTWGPPTLVIQEIAQKLKMQAESGGRCPYIDYLNGGLRELQAQEVDFQRPPANSDKLYMSIGGKDVIEVAHPSPPEHLRLEGIPRIHLGPVASGKDIIRDDTTRQNLATRLGIKAFDSEFDAVVESIHGNRKDSYAFIRGITDYKDGTRKKEWAAYSSLAAAAVTKAIICGMDPPDD